MNPLLSSASDRASSFGTHSADGSQPCTGCEWAAYTDEHRAARGKSLLEGDTSIMDSPRSLKSFSLLLLAFGNLAADLDSAVCSGGVVARSPRSVNQLFLSRPIRFCKTDGSRAGMRLPAMVSTAEDLSISTHICSHCGHQSASRNKLYAHLRENAKTCGAASGLNLTAGKLGKISKSILCVGYGASGSEVAAKLLKDKIETVHGLSIEVMTWASNWRFRQSPLLQQKLPAICDVFIYSTRMKEPASIDKGDCKEAWLSKINAELMVHDVRIFDRQFAPSGPSMLIQAERDCTSRTYECFVPLEYLVGESALNAVEQSTKVVDNIMLWQQLKSALRALSNPKTKHSGKVARKYGVHDDWLLNHRWHNFARASAVPSDAAVRRIIDRFHVYGDFNEPMLECSGRSFARLRITADDVLDGQVQRMVGTAICMLHGWLPPDFVEFALDPRHIINTPSLPDGLTMLRACKLEWYSQSNVVLRERSRPAAVQSVIDRFDESIVNSIISSEAASAHVAADWLRQMEHEICPQIRKQMTQLQARIVPPPMRSQAANGNPSRCPPDYDDVLRLLRAADASGKWPSTTRARARVLSANEMGGSISVVCPARASTILHEHGASQVPRGNLLFPDLVDAVFELEQRIAPGRLPSSHVAINRRAIFHPHTDAGAGHGQTSSLIVGLGDYSGGELAVEDTVVSIRYEPHEFDGWRSRHWTLPFEGERFSLVWFTPTNQSLEGSTDLQGRYAYA